MQDVSHAPGKVPGNTELEELLSGRTMQAMLSRDGVGPDQLRAMLVRLGEQRRQLGLDSPEVAVADRRPRGEDPLA